MVFRLQPSSMTRFIDKVRMVIVSFAPFTLNFQRRCQGRSEYVIKKIWRMFVASMYKYEWHFLYYTYYLRTIYLVTKISKVVTLSNHNCTWIWIINFPAHVHKCHIFKSAISTYIAFVLFRNLIFLLFFTNLPYRYPLLFLTLLFHSNWITISYYTENIIFKGTCGVIYHCFEFNCTIFG